MNPKEMTRSSQIGGFDSVVIVRDDCDVPCGVALDVSGYSQPVIHAGHLLAKNQESGEVFPLNVDGGAYEALPSNCVYYGINKSSVLKSLAACAVLVDGTVNAAAAAQLIGAEYPEAALKAIPQVEFLYWGLSASKDLRIIQALLDDVGSVYLGRVTTEGVPRYEGYEGLWLNAQTGLGYTVKKSPNVGDKLYRIEDDELGLQVEECGTVASVTPVEHILVEEEGIRIPLIRDTDESGLYGWSLAGNGSYTLYTRSPKPNAGDPLYFLEDGRAVDVGMVVAEYIPA